MRSPIVGSSLLLLLLPLAAQAADFGDCDRDRRCGFTCCAASELCTLSAVCVPIPDISSALAAIPTDGPSLPLIESAIRAAPTNTAALASLVDKYQPNIELPQSIIGLDGNPIPLPTVTAILDDLKDGAAVFTILPIGTGVVDLDGARETLKSAVGGVAGGSATPTASVSATPSVVDGPTAVPDSAAVRVDGGSGKVLAIGMAAAAFFTGLMW